MLVPRPAPFLSVLLALALTGCTPEPAPGPRLFTDVTSSADVAFEHFTGATGRYYIPEIMGSGCALFDYDGDEDLDLYAVQGAPLESASPVKAPSDRLFRNDTVGPGGSRGPLRFTDVTAPAGLVESSYGIGCAVGDHDGDGDLDLYVTNFGPNVLQRNNGNGTFTDVTEQAGAGDPGFSTSAAFIDYDRDGRLDLFVANYVRFSTAENRTCTRAGGQPDYCGPVSYPPAPDRLYHNEGGGRFSDASVRSGISKRFGNGLGVVAADFDGDGWPDIFVANDATPNLLWINQRDGTFEERALASGCALSSDGLALAGMGITAGDVDRNGSLDVFITHEVSEPNTLYAGRGGGRFEDATSQARLGVPSLPYSGFGTVFFDYDSDGWLDLFVANGAVRRIAEQSTRPWPYVQPDQLFRNQNGRFDETTASAGLDAGGVQSGRGAACGDLDLDGDIDLVVSNGGGSLRVLRNDAPRLGTPGRVRLLGPKGNLQAPGTRVALKLSDGSSLIRFAGTEGSYASAMASSWIHFAWPRDVEPQECTVVWPDGSGETVPWPRGKAELTIQARQVLLPRAGREPILAAAGLAGSRACAECHPEHAERQKTHHMALTGRLVEPGRPGGWPAPEVLGKPVQWPGGSATPAPSLRASPDGLFLDGRDEQGRTASGRAAIVFGSGAHGMTMLCPEDGSRIRELKLSYTPARSSWTQTPGARSDPDPLGSPSTQDRSFWCLSCHSTALAWKEDRLDPDRSLFGIHCERCHGPAGMHVENMRRGQGGMAILNPASLRADEGVLLCAECHRKPADIDPADALKRDSTMARHAGAGLLLSACFRKSPPERTITCVECHDPHRNIDKARDEFDRACRRCHAEPANVHRPGTEWTAGRCTGCHMPVAGDALAGLAFTDHWIRVPGSPAPIDSPRKQELMDALEASYREALDRSARGPEHRATLHTRLGDLLMAGGRKEEGIGSFQAALSLSPPYADRVSLAERLDRAGRPVEAIQAMEDAIRSEPAFNRARHSLVRLLRARGDLERAAAALKEWEKALPNDPTRKDAEKQGRLPPSPGAKEGSRP